MYIISEKVPWILPVMAFFAGIDALILLDIDQYSTFHKRFTFHYIEVVCVKFMFQYLLIHHDHSICWTKGVFRVVLWTWYKFGNT